MRRCEKVPEEFFCEGIELSKHLDCEHWTGECHEARLRKKGEMQRCEVAVPDEDLWVSSDKTVVNVVKQAWRSISSSDSDDGFDMSVGEHRVDVACSALILSGKVTVDVLRVCAELYPIAQMFEVENAFIDLVTGGGSAGRSDYSNDIVFLESWWSENVHRCRATSGSRVS